MISENMSVFLPQKKKLSIVVRPIPNRKLVYFSSIKIGVRVEDIYDILNFSFSVIREEVRVVRNNSMECYL